MPNLKCLTWNLNFELNLSSRSQNWYISTEDRKEKLWLKSIGCRMMSSSIYALIEIAALRVRYSRATQNCYNNTYSHCLLAFSHFEVQSFYCKSKFILIRSNFFFVKPGLRCGVCTMYIRNLIYYYRSMETWHVLNSKFS